MGGVHIAPFPHAYRYGWDEETAVAFALKELDQLLASISSPADTAGFIIEPVLGDGGYIPTPVGFLQGLRERADKHGIVLIVDEVQAGVGRTGKFWGHDWAGIIPDVVITAKGLASGFPISAIAASTELMGKAWPGSQGGTYGGNAVAAAAGVATLGVIERENLVTNALIRGDELRAGLESLKGDFASIGDVRGRGLMQSVEFTAADGTPDAAAALSVQQAAIKEELLLLTCGPHGNVVRIIPALNVSSDEIQAGLARFTQALKTTAI
jgi:4-aminobutyrate aminotransferase